MPKYFGTDGIRGKSPEWLNDQMAYNIGYAIGAGLKAKKLLVGRDTRKSGEHLSPALIQGALDSSVEVINLGVVSTPMLAYLTTTEKCFGAMITASHNPSTDNGIKIILNGEKSTEAQEDILETYLFQSKEFKIKEELRINKEILNTYLKAIEKLNFPKTKLKIVIDSAHGSLSNWADEILSNYANIHKTMGDTPDGLNINKNVGSTHIEALVSSTPKGMIGFAFDGDGDRLICVDEEGNIVTGDQILAIVAEHFNYKNVVFTQMLNPGIKSSLLKLGISSLETSVGDKYVTSAMNEHQYSIGGENSGHLIFKDIWLLGDGIISALVIIYIMNQTGMNLHSLLKKIKLFPEFLINFKIDSNSINNFCELKDQIESFSEKLTGFQKVLVRKSGTEMVIRVYASFSNKSSLNKLKKYLYKIMDN